MVGANDKTSAKFTVGKKYHVNLLIVSTPSNFFVQLVSDEAKTGNMMNNLDNYYRNDMLDKDLQKE